MTKIAIGSDDAGAVARRALIAHLRERGVEVDDFGHDEADPSYPSIAREVAERVAAGAYERAILLCGTGIGVSIVANKVAGVYAALCHDTYSARRARASNNAQILAMGGRVVAPEMACEIADAWLDSEFGGGRSIPKVQEVQEIDREFRHA